MELKLLKGDLNTGESCGSNCTFMELKWVNRHRICETFYVLIVALWNWNLDQAARIRNSNKF